MLSRIQQHLIDAKAITAEQFASLEKEANQTRANVDDLLVERGYISELNFAKLKSELFELPFIDLEDVEIPEDVLKLLPQSVAEHYQIIVFDKKASQLRIALVDPTNYHGIEAVDFWAKKEGYSYTLYISTVSGCRAALRKYTAFKKEVSDAIEVLEERATSDRKGRKGEKLVDIIRKAPVAKIVSLMIQEAVDLGTSDIHIEPSDPETRIRFRIDGILRTYLTIPKSHHGSVVSRIKVLADMKIDETRIPQDGRIRLVVEGQDINLRVSTLPVLENEKVVMRILPSASHVITLEELGFWQHPLAGLKNLIDRPSGVLLVSGPTGSGKSTTLYSILSDLNKESVNITTLEDPVEYFFSGINQVQINPDVGLTFASGLRSILRQDPNIVMVGEIRDRETAELATHAALTGHFMLSTIHAKDVVGVIPRLIDMHVEPFLIAAALNTILGQRLVRKLCDACKVPVDIPASMEKEIKTEFDMIPSQDILAEAGVTKDSKLYRGQGCDECGKTGYRGRTVVSEVLAMTEELEAMLSKSFSIDDLSQEMRRQGNITLKQDAILKAMRGLTSLEEVLRVTRE